VETGLAALSLSRTSSRASNTIGRQHNATASSSRAASRTRQPRTGGAGLDPAAVAFMPGNTNNDGQAGARSQRGRIRQHDRGEASQPHAQGRTPMNSRKAAFQARLTTEEAAPTDLEAEAMERAATGAGSKSHQHMKWEKNPRGRGSAVVVEADDLASKLTRGLSMRPFLECPIVS
jgi:hypothetical protein